VDEQEKKTAEKKVDLTKAKASIASISETALALVGLMEMMEAGHLEPDAEFYRVMKRRKAALLKVYGDAMDAFVEEVHRVYP